VCAFRVDFATCSGKMRIMLDSRLTLAYIRFTSGRLAPLPADLGTVQEARQTGALLFGEPLARGHVCLRLPTSRLGRIHASTDDGRGRRGVSSTHQRRCVTAGPGHCETRLASPARGGCPAACPGFAGRGKAPKGTSYERDRAVPKEPHPHRSVRLGQSSRLAASPIPPWAARRQGRLVRTSGSLIQVSSLARALCEGRQGSRAYRRGPAGLAAPADRPRRSRRETSNDR